MRSIDTKCLFCDGLKGHGDNIAIALPELAGKRLIVFETINLLVTAELHPVVDYPYFLIVNKEHCPAFSVIPTDLNREIKDIVEWGRNQFGDGYRAVLFEHGEPTGMHQSQSVFHAHMHLVLLKETVIKFVAERIREYGFNLFFFEINTNQIHQAIRGIQAKVNYLFFIQDNQGFYAEETELKKIPSQTFRRILYEFYFDHLDFPDWKSNCPEKKQVFAQRVRKLPKQVFIG